MNKGERNNREENHEEVRYKYENSWFLVKTMLKGLRSKYELRNHEIADLMGIPRQRLNTLGKTSFVYEDELETMETGWGSDKPEVLEYVRSIRGGERIEGTIKADADEESKDWTWKYKTNRRENQDFFNGIKEAKGIKTEHELADFLGISKGRMTTLKSNWGYILDIELEKMRNSNGGSLPEVQEYINKALLSKKVKNYERVKEGTDAQVISVLKIMLEKYEKALAEASESNEDCELAIMQVRLATAEEIKAAMYTLLK